MNSDLVETNKLLYSHFNGGFIIFIKTFMK